MEARSAHHALAVQTVHLAGVLAEGPTNVRVDRNALPVGHTYTASCAAILVARRGLAEAARAVVW